MIEPLMSYFSGLALTLDCRELHIYTLNSVVNHTIIPHPHQKFMPPPLVPPPMGGGEFPLIPKSLWAALECST